MRIDRLYINNYRQFREIELRFTRNSNRDLHIIIGKNGAGKTNILNAINWCLYKEEPHLSKDSQQLPILNLQTIEDSQEGEDRDIKVEIGIKTDNERKITFSRKASYRVYKGGNKPAIQNSYFEVLQADNSGTKIISGDVANNYVERFVPIGIREFFFFDGERLDNYFRKNTAQNVRHSIFLISQVELLENRMEHRLHETLSDLRKEAGKISPDIDKTQETLEKAEENLRDVEKQMEECIQQIEICSDGIKEHEGKLRGAPEVSELQDEKLSLKSDMKHKKRLKEDKQKDKQDLIFDLGKTIMLWPAIKESLEIIEKKKRNKEIPPTSDKSLLEKILKNKSCSICGRPLDNTSGGRVKNLLKDVELSSVINQNFSNMDNPLQRLRDNVVDFKEKIKRITDEIENLDKDLERIEQRLNKIERTIGGFDVEKVKEWQAQLTKYEQEKDNQQERLGNLKARKNDYEKVRDKLKDQLDSEMKNEKKVMVLRKKIIFCSNALDFVRKTKQVIMNKIREQIESESNKLFSKLIWKKESFDKIIIQENYDINLLHSMGYECLGSISAAEREILALSFTLALHKTSGFDAPILIDAPVGRVSDENRKNLGEVFSEVSRDKQTILLFAPSDYSPDISARLDENSSTRRSLKVTEHEKVTVIEEM
jgi:DNA sulfur modification protein DndD